MPRKSTRKHQWLTINANHSKSPVHHQAERTQMAVEAKTKAASRIIARSTPDRKFVASTMHSEVKKHAALKVHAAAAGAHGIPRSKNSAGETAIRGSRTAATAARHAARSIEPLRGAQAT
mmetsp:Transcript_87315/g.167965  ORF Transcript_87315/g.167965 Transcript_87315/m.167965 type:complete len:120 (+) Transcript_87315:1330-1689(+)